MGGGGGWDPVYQLTSRVVPDDSTHWATSQHSSGAQGWREGTGLLPRQAEPLAQALHPPPHRAATLRRSMAPQLGKPAARKESENLPSQQRAVAWPWLGAPRAGRQAQRGNREPRTLWSLLADPRDEQRGRGGGGWDECKHHKPQGTDHAEAGKGGRRRGLETPIFLASTWPTWQNGTGLRGLAFSVSISCFASVFHPSCKFRCSPGLVPHKAPETPWHGRGSPPRGWQGSCPRQPAPLAEGTGRGLGADSLRVTSHKEGTAA